MRFNKIRPRTARGRGMCRGHACSVKDSYHMLRSVGIEKEHNLELEARLPLESNLLFSLH